MSVGGSFVVHAGARAADHVRSHGIAARDIACVPAAAGGPKGLALIPLDRLLFGGWLRDVEHTELIGASIGAWRMAAAATADPVAALNRLSEGYVAQTYPRKPTTKYVSDECRKLARCWGTPAQSNRARASACRLSPRARAAYCRRIDRKRRLRARHLPTRGRVRGSPRIWNACSSTREVRRFRHARPIRSG
jgi:hypothetical protein